MMGGFWYKPVDLQLRTNIFRALCYSRLISGMICFVLEEQDYKRIDRKVIKNGKRILKGDATAKEQQRDLTLGYRYKGDHYVFAAIGIAPIRLELVVARLRFLQRRQGTLTSVSNGSR